VKHFLPITAIFVLAVLPAHASEEAKELLKVPPAADRPLAAEADAPAQSDAATNAAPVATPTPESTEAQPPPPADAPAENKPSEAEIVPEPYPVSRYALLWENSPFQNESVAPPVESPGLSQRFALGGILRENGEYSVWIRERATQQSHKVNKTSANKLGLTLVEVAESPGKRSEASATVRLGAEIGVIKFDNTAAAGGVPAMPSPFVPQPTVNAGMRPFPQAQRPGVLSPVQPIQPGVPVQQPQAAGAINPGAVAPGIVPPVPGPGVPSDGQAQVAPGQGQAMPPPRVIRRRAIVPAAP
jgi:hypothetical protein